MDTNSIAISKLKLALTEAGISHGQTCFEESLRPILIDFLTFVQDMASDICSPFNSFLLLCALQHILPNYVIKPKVGFEADVQILFNNASALAFRFSSSTKDASVKFTVLDYAKAAKSADKTWLDDYFDVVFDIHLVVGIIDKIIKTLRLLGKGSAVLVDLSQDDIWEILKIDMEAALQHKLTEYDERVIRNGDILVRHALPLGIAKPETPLKCVVVNLNWKEFRKGNLNPNPIPLVFGMDAIYTLTCFHANELINLFDNRVHVEDLFVFLSAIFEPYVNDAQNNVRFAGQGYGFTQKSELVDYIANRAPAIYAQCFQENIFPNGTAFILESLDSNYWKAVIPHMLNFISHDFQSKDSFDCLLFRPVKFAYILDDETVFLHFGTVIHFFAHLWDEFQKTGKFGEIKGRLFEQLVSDTLEAIDGFKRIWEPGKKLKFTIDGKAATDVDVFVRKNELAFMVSCKSYSLNRAYELGNGQLTWGRSEEAKGWFRFAHRTAKAIADHCNELSIPPDIKAICPFVCTGWPEYLYDPSEDYFMKDGTPRIATLREIENLLKSLDESKILELLSDRWTVHLEAS